MSLSLVIVGVASGPSASIDKPSLADALTPLLLLEQAFLQILFLRVIGISSTHPDDAISLTRRSR
jgi:hypothetical protein